VQPFGPKLASGDMNMLLYRGSAAAFCLMIAQLADYDAIQSL